MRKTIGKAMAATTSLALALSMAACGSSSENAEEATKVGGTITIWTWEQPGKAFEAAAKGFQEANPGTTVKVENVGNPAIWDKITTGLAAGGQGLPDIMNVGIDYIGGYMDKFPDAFANLSDYGADDLKDDFPSGVMKSATRDGKIYGLPFEVNTGALVYDVKMFEEAGITEDDISTWDGFIESDTDGNITMNGEAGVKAMELIKEANDAGIVIELPGTSDDTSWQVQQGNVATLVDRSYLPGVLKTKFPDAKNRWKVTALPAVEEGGLRSVVPGATYLSVANASKNKKTAWEFIKYALGTTEGQKAMYESQGLFPGYLPFIKEDLNTPDEFFNNENVNEVFIKQLEDETPELNFTGDYAKALKAMIDAQVQVLTKGADPQKALDEAAERLANETGRKIA